MNDRCENWSRREFVGGLTLAGAAGFVGLNPVPAAAEPLPETPAVRIDHVPGVCTAPQYVAEELLRSEGFTDVRYIRYPGVQESNRGLATGEIHFSVKFVGGWAQALDAGDPIVILAGIHVGCFELFVTSKVRTLSDLKGKTIGITQPGSGRHVFLVSLLQHVGLDHRRDVTFATQPRTEAMRLLAEERIDAYIAFPPDPQELRANRVGRVLLSTTTDRPWSQYLCCMLAANREFVHKYPVATKRAVRAILKAATLCSLEPERTARVLVNKGFESDANYVYAVQALKELPYRRWGDYNPEDAVRFYALRLHEAGMIKSSPQKIIAQGTDWRFLNEVKKELKG